MNLSSRGRGVLLLLSLFVVIVAFGLAGCDKATCPQPTSHLAQLVHITGIGNQALTGSAGPLRPDVAFRSGIDNQWHSGYLVSVLSHAGGYWNLGQHH